MLDGDDEIIFPQKILINFNILAFFKEREREKRGSYLYNEKKKEAREVFL
jgi:hypothetical protein